MELHRQGDVWLVPWVAPKGFTDNEHVLAAMARARKRSKVRRIIIQRGEVTGHAHALQGRGLDTLTLGDIQLVVATEPVQLVHDEHRAQMIEAGVYQIVRQRELDPVLNSERFITD